MFWVSNPHIWDMLIERPRERERERGYRWEKTLTTWKLYSLHKNFFRYHLNSCCKFGLLVERQTFSYQVLNSLDFVQKWRGVLWSDIYPHTGFCFRAMLSIYIIHKHRLSPVVLPKALNVGILGTPQEI